MRSTLFLTLVGLVMGLAMMDAGDEPRSGVGLFRAFVARVEPTEDRPPCMGAREIAPEAPAPDEVVGTAPRHDEAPEETQEP